MHILRAPKLLFLAAACSLVPSAAAQNVGEVGTFYFRFRTYEIKAGTPLPGSPCTSPTPALPPGFVCADADFNIKMSDLNLLPAPQFTYGGPSAFGELRNGHYGLAQNLSIHWDTGNPQDTLDLSRVVLLLDVFCHVNGSARFQTQLVPASDPEGDFDMLKVLAGFDIPYDKPGAPVGMVTEDVPFDTAWDLFPDAPLRAFRFTPGGTINSGDTAWVTIAFDAGVPVGTPTGLDVEDDLYAMGADSSAVTLTFDEVTAFGETTLDISDTGPPTPSGFSLGLDPTYYTIETTATFTGDVKVCIDYSDISYGVEEDLRLLHSSDGGVNWYDITEFPIDTDNNVICGITTSFSIFVVVEDLGADARALSAAISLVPLVDFDAPNAKAAKGRRTALANRARDAADAIAIDDTQGAIASLRSLLKRIDGLNPPPDWLHPTSARDALRDDVEFLLKLLALQ